MDLRWKFYQGSLLKEILQFSFLYLFWGEGILGQTWSDGQGLSALYSGITLSCVGGQP